MTGLCGTEKELALALSIIETEGPPRGLFLNRGKSLIYAPINSTIVHPLRDIPFTSDGFTLLGSPIGPSYFCEETVARRIHKVQEMIARIRDLEDSQLETTLLRSCLALPKLTHVLRTCPSCLIPKALGAFDNLMRNALSDLAGSPIPNWSWLKASLPSSLGGLNLRSGSCHAPAANIGSLHQCRLLVIKIRGQFVPPHTLLAHSLQSLSTAAGRPDWDSTHDVDVPRPADVYLPCWKGGRPAALDITVISTMQQSTIQPAADNQGPALLVAETRDHKVTHNPIPTSLFLPRLQRTFLCSQLDVKMLCCLLCLMHS